MEWEKKAAPPLLPCTRNDGSRENRRGLDGFLKKKDKKMSERERHGYGGVVYFAAARLGCTGEHPFAVLFGNRGRIK